MRRVYDDDSCPSSPINKRNRQVEQESSPALPVLPLLEYSDCENDLDIASSPPQFVGSESNSDHDVMAEEVEKLPVVTKKRARCHPTKASQEEIKDVAKDSNVISTRLTRLRARK